MSILRNQERQDPSKEMRLNNLWSKYNLKEGHHRHHNSSSRLWAITHSEDLQWKEEDHQVESEWRKAWEEVVHLGAVVQECQWIDTLRPLLTWRVAMNHRNHHLKQEQIAHLKQIYKPLPHQQWLISKRGTISTISHQDHLVPSLVFNLKTNKINEKNKTKMTMELSATLNLCLVWLQITRVGKILRTSKTNSQLRMKDTEVWAMEIITKAVYQIQTPLLKLSSKIQIITTISTNRTRWEPIHSLRMRPRSRIRCIKVFCSSHHLRSSPTLKYRA